MLWLPATAVGPAEESANTSVFELDPSFSAVTPSKSVKASSDVESVERSVPIVVNAVFCAVNVASCVFHGVSTPWLNARIDVTVVATSNPVPLVADPNDNPTVPIATSS